MNYPMAGLSFLNAGWTAGIWTILMIWSLIWKGLALWKAAGRKEKWWFVALLVINTIGILEILYLFVFSKSKKENIQPQA